MTTFAVFANGTFWGSWSAGTEADACQMAADEVGTDGNTDGLEAFAVTDEQSAALCAWAEAGAVDQCPVNV